MAEHVSIGRAREMSGLRLVLLQGLPSPWSQAAKGLLEIRGVAYTPVHRSPDDAPDALLDWTHQDSFPAAMYDDERPRTGWAEILFLAERLGSGPSLVPADPAERAWMLGLSHEICGEMGLGWCRRLVQLGPLIEANPEMASFALKYGSSPAETKAAQQRIVDVLTLLRTQLEGQREQGRRYLVGEALSALDVYWATFCNLISPLPLAQLPMDENTHAMFAAREPEVLEALGSSLLAHRDFVYETHLRLPVEL